MNRSGAWVGGIALESGTRTSSKLLNVVSIAQEVSNHTVINVLALSRSPQVSSCVSSSQVWGWIFLILIN